MKQELQYLGFGLIVSIYALIGDGGLIIPWEIQLVFGLLLMAYGTYIFLQRIDKKGTLKYIVPAWGLFLVTALIVFINQPQQGELRDSDLGAATNFEGIQTCEEGELKAMADLESGKLRYIFGGFGSRQPLAENLQKLGIEVIKTQGVVGLPNNCYNDIMYKEIQKRFGQDVFNRENK